jgi:uncharacterized protein (DUF433 family)
MFKRLFVTAGVTVLAVGVVGATAAFAHGPGDGVRHRLARGVVAVAAGELGMEPAGLVAELREGKSIADVAEGQDVALEEITDAVIGASDERLDEAVESGRITRERADEILASIEERLPDFLERDWPFRYHHHYRCHLLHQARGLIDVTAEELGMENADVLAALREGKSIADIAEEQGGSTEAIIEEFMVRINEVLNVAVENGFLTEEEAARKAENTREHVTNHIDDPWPFPRMRGRQGDNLRSDRRTIESFDATPLL